jgi:hypothetical protein
MEEYSLTKPDGTPETLRVDVNGRVGLALPEGTLGYLGRIDARRLAHDLLKALEPDLDGSAAVAGDGASLPEPERRSTSAIS